MAPMSSPAMYGGTRSQVMPVLPCFMASITARPSVTAGLRWAPLSGPATTTPMNTANAHAMVMTIQPEFWALDFDSRTPATTPSPNRMRVAVPKISATIFSIIGYNSLDIPVRWDRCEDR